MIEVVSIAGLATVQDGGRPGRMHEGVPPGGALVPALMARANGAVRNVHDETALEVFGSITLVLRGTRRTVLVSGDDGQPRRLADGETFRLEGAGARVHYIAVRGGIAVPIVLGGRGTFLPAALGGHEGRALRRGDVLRIGDASEEQAPLPVPPDLAAPVRVVPGPDLDRFDAGALAMLLSSGFVVDPRSDRAGVRLEGPVLLRPRDETGPSAPMVRGAVQIPPAGLPIVLGPDHPTTGGYPVLATVVRADLGALCAHPIGTVVRFVTCVTWR